MKKDKRLSDRKPNRERRPKEREQRNGLCKTTMKNDHKELRTAGSEGSFFQYFLAVLLAVLLSLFTSYSLFLLPFCVRFRAGPIAFMWTRGQAGNPLSERYYAGKIFSISLDNSKEIV